MRHKRGDYSPCGSMRFWQYQSYFKKDGDQSERWVPTHHFMRMRTHADELSVLNSAAREWHQIRAERRAA